MVLFCLVSAIMSARERLNQKTLGDHLSNDAIIGDMSTILVKKNPNRKNSSRVCEIKGCYGKRRHSSYTFDNMSSFFTPLTRAAQFISYLKIGHLVRGKLDPLVHQPRLEVSATLHPSVRSKPSDVPGVYNPTTQQTRKQTRTDYL